jgi:hypothetical protein
MRLSWQEGAGVIAGLVRAEHAGLYFLVNRVGDAIPSIGAHWVMDAPHGRPRRSGKGRCRLCPGHSGQLRELLGGAPVTSGDGRSNKPVKEGGRELGAA